LFLISERWIASDINNSVTPSSKSGVDRVKQFSSGHGDWQQPVPVEEVGPTLELFSGRLDYHRCFSVLTLNGFNHLPGHLIVDS
jgi:hypothetical protein